MAVGDADGLDEAVIVRALQAGGVPAGGDDAERLVAHDAQDAFIRARGVAEDRDLVVQPVLRVLLQEAQTIDAGEADIDRVDVALDLRDEGAVIGDVERRPQLLHDLAAIVLEAALKATYALVALAEILCDRV